MAGYDVASLRSHVLRAVRTLALPVDDLFASIPAVVHAADELLEDLGDAAHAIRMLEHQRAESADKAQRVLQLERQVDAMIPSSLDDVFWTRDAMRNDPRWIEIRRLACEVLVANGWA